MNTWSETGYVSGDMMCPKCGGVLLIHGDDILIHAACTRCLTTFVKNVQKKRPMSDGGAPLPGVILTTSPGNL